MSKFILAAMFLGVIAVPCNHALAAPEKGNSRNLADDAVNREWRKLHAGPRHDRMAALKRLGGELYRLSGRRKDRFTLGIVQRNKLIDCLIKEYEQSEGKDEKAKEFKRLLVEVLARHGKTPRAKQFIFKTMETAPADIRERILMWLGHPDGVSGDELFDKVDKWAKKGIINKNQRPGFLARFGKERAIPRILKIVDATADREEFFYAAWALQDAGATKELSHAFRRIKELKLHKKFRDSPNGLHWIKTDKVEDYLQQAQGNDLEVILDLLPHGTP